MHREQFTPELSVVIPVYNEQAGLGRAIFSALPGTGRIEFELRSGFRQRRKPRQFSFNPC
jgi:hypothetical protein